MCDEKLDHTEIEEKICLENANYVDRPWEVQLTICANAQFTDFHFSFLLSVRTKIKNANKTKFGDKMVHEFDKSNIYVFYCLENSSCPRCNTCAIHRFGRKY